MNIVTLSYNEQTFNTGLVCDYDLQNSPGHDNSMQKKGGALVVKNGSFF